MQWAIFGIKSVCQGNPQNQEYIKKMKVQGVVNDELLQENDVECRLVDGKIKIKRKIEGDASTQ